MWRGISIFALVLFGALGAFSGFASAFKPECRSLREDQWVRYRPQNQPESAYIAKLLGDLHVRVSVEFRLEAPVAWPTADLRALPAQIGDTLNELTRFYKEQGIHLVIGWRVSRTDPFDIMAPTEHDTIVVYLQYEQEQMRAHAWAMNPKWDAKKRSRIWAHEMGHWIGLPDEYEGANWFGGLGEEDSLMRDWAHPNARLYPRHLATIEQILCQ